MGQHRTLWRCPAHQQFSIGLPLQQNLLPGTRWKGPRKCSGAEVMRHHQWPETRGLKSEMLQEANTFHYTEKGQSLHLTRALILECVQ